MAIVTLQQKPINRVRYSAGGGGTTIAGGAGFKLVSFENLSNGGYVGDKFYTSGYQSSPTISNGTVNGSALVGWGNQGTASGLGFRDWTGVSGCYGDTSSNKRAGKTSCLALKIAANTAGRPGDGDGSCVIDGKQGDYGFYIDPVSPVTEGGDYRLGGWVKYPSGFNNSSNSGMLKTLRLGNWTGGAIDNMAGWTDILMLNSIQGNYNPVRSSPLQDGWAFGNEASPLLPFTPYNTVNSAFPSNLYMDDGNWHWIEQYVHVTATAANAIRRLWVDNTLVFEYKGANLKYLNTSGTYTSISTVTPNQGTLAGSAIGLGRFAYHTYYNGGSPVDQTSYCSLFLFSNNNESASDMVTDSFGNKIIGNTYI